MHKNFLSVKGITLTGDVGFEFKRFAPIPRGKQYPSSAEGANLLET